MENTSKSSTRHIMRLPEVIAVSGLGRSSIYEYMSRGDFPPHRRIGRRAVGWDSLEVFAWVNTRMGGQQMADHTDAQRYRLCLSEALKNQRWAEWQVIELAEESDYYGEARSAEENARLELAWRRITRIDQQLAVLNGPDWGGQ